MTFTLWIVLQIVRVAEGATKFTVFGYAMVFLLFGGFALVWFFEYVGKTQRAVFNRYLDQAD